MTNVGQKKELVEHTAAKGGECNKNMSSNKDESPLFLHNLRSAGTTQASAATASVFEKISARLQDVSKRTVSKIGSNSNLIQAHSLTSNKAPGEMSFSGFAIVTMELAIALMME